MQMKQMADGDDAKVATNSDYYRLLAAVRCRIEEVETTLAHHPECDMGVSGATLCAVLVTPYGKASFNLGDSRAIACSHDRNSHPVVKALTWDQKPSTTRERLRVEREGGQIDAYRDRSGRPSGPPRVWFKLPGGNAQGIAMTRSLGDIHGKAWGLSACPVVEHFGPSATDETLVVASDGLWDVLGNQETSRRVLQCADPAEAAASLRGLASDRWMVDEGVLADDMTIIVAMVRPLSVDALTEDGAESIAGPKVSVDVSDVLGGLGVSYNNLTLTAHHTSTPAADPGNGNAWAHTCPITGATSYR